MFFSVTQIGITRLQELFSYGAALVVQVKGLLVQYERSSEKER